MNLIEYLKKEKIKRNGKLYKYYIISTQKNDICVYIYNYILKMPKKIKLYDFIKDNDICSVVKYIYTNKLDANDIYVCFYFLDNEVLDKFVQELYESSYFNTKRFLVVLRNVRNEYQKILLENINMNLIDDIIFDIIDILIEKENNELVLYLYDVFSNQYPHRDIFHDIIVENIIKYRNVEIANIFEERYMLYIPLSSLLKNDIEELLSQNILNEFCSKQKQLDFDKNIISKFFEKESFGCLFKFLNIEKIKILYESDCCELMKDYLYNFNRKYHDDILLIVDKDSFIKKFKFIIKINNILKIDYSSYFSDKIISNFIFPKLIKNKILIPFELIRENHKIIDKIDKIDWENCEYNILPKHVLPFWKEFWLDKIKNNFNKDQIIHFYEDIVYNDNMKYVYDQIQQSIDYAPNSEKYEIVKNEFENYKKIK